MAKFVSLSTVKWNSKSLLLAVFQRAVAAQIPFSKDDIVESLLEKKYSDKHSLDYKDESK